MVSCLSMVCILCKSKYLDIYCIGEEEMINYEKRWEEEVPGIRKLFITKAQWVNHKKEMWLMELHHQRKMRKMRKEHKEEIKRILEQ